MVHQKCAAVARRTAWFDNGSAWSWDWRWTPFWRIESLWLIGRLGFGHRIGPKWHWPLMTLPKCILQKQTLKRTAGNCISWPERIPKTHETLIFELNTQTGAVESEDVYSQDVSLSFDCRWLELLFSKHIFPLFHAVSSKDTTNVRFEKDIHLENCAPNQVNLIQLMPSCQTRWRVNRVNVARQGKTQVCVLKTIAYKAIALTCCRMTRWGAICGNEYTAADTRQMFPCYFCFFDFLLPWRQTLKFKSLSPNFWNISIGLQVGKCVKCSPPEQPIQASGHEGLPRMDQGTIARRSVCFDWFRHALKRHRICGIVSYILILCIHYGTDPETSPPNEDSTDIEKTLPKTITYTSYRNGP